MNIVNDRTRFSPEPLAERIPCNNGLNCWSVDIITIFSFEIIELTLIYLINF